MPKYKARNRISMPKYKKKKTRTQAHAVNSKVTSSENGLDITSTSPCLPSLTAVYTCHICNKNLSAATTLRDHVNSHTREVAFPCPKCGRKFSRKQYLSTHLKVHANEERREAQLSHLPFKCMAGAECKEAFTSQELLDAHRTKHTFPCPFCPKAATSRRLLNYHIMGHTGEFPEQCKKCKKYYTSSTILLSHKCRGPKLDENGIPKEDE